MIPFLYQRSQGEMQPRARWIRSAIRDLMGLGLLALSLSLGCGDDPTSSTKSEALAVVSGDGQGGVVGDTLAAPMTVLLTDQNGRILEGRRIDFTVVQGNARTEPNAVVTDETGHARTVVILGDSPGEVTVEAKAFGTMAVATLGASAIVLPPASMRIVGGNGQTGRAGSDLPSPLAVTIENERGEPVVGEIVVFRVVVGSAELTVASDTTDSHGISSSQLRLGDDAGEVLVTAGMERYELEVTFTANILDPAVPWEFIIVSVERAIGLLFIGGGTAPGVGGGQIVVSGSTFVFEQYSPDGVFFLDGQLTMDLLASPITVKGSPSFRNEQGEAPIVVDMTIDASTDPITYGGTITFDGVAIDLATLE
jgi:hypothetical protein